MLKTARARHDGPGLRFTVRTGSGHEFPIDDETGDSGARPAELLLAAQAGCTALDVATILDKKHQVPVSYEVAVTGEQREDRHPHTYGRIDFVHELARPDLDETAVRRAIELSATRYCTVKAMLSSGVAEVHHGYRIRRGDGRPDLTGEVVVTGPDADPDTLAGTQLSPVGASRSEVA